MAVKGISQEGSCALLVREGPLEANVCLSDDRVGLLVCRVASFCELASVLRRKFMWVHV